MLSRQARMRVSERRASACLGVMCGSRLQKMLSVCLQSCVDKPAGTEGLERNLIFERTMQTLS